MIGSEHAAPEGSTASDLQRTTRNCSLAGGYFEGELMAYLRATRYGLTKIEPPPALLESGWRQVWEHPSGLLAMRHPSTGHWVVASLNSDGWVIGEGWSSSLRAAALRIERRMSGAR